MAEPQTVELDVDEPFANKPINMPRIAMVMEGGAPYVTGPRRTRVAAPSSVPLPAPAPPQPAAQAAAVPQDEQPIRAGSAVAAPAVTERPSVVIAFQVVGQTFRSEVNLATLSVCQRYLMLDVTDRPNAFLPFRNTLRESDPRSAQAGQSVIALPEGGRFAYSLSVEGSPVLVFNPGGRVLYCVPVVDRVEVDETTLDLFNTDLFAKPKEPDDDGKERDDRAVDAVRPEFDPDDPANLDFVVDDEDGDDVSPLLR